MIKAGVPVPKFILRKHLKKHKWYCQNSPCFYIVSLRIFIINIVKSRRKIPRGNSLLIAMVGEKPTILQEESESNRTDKSDTLRQQ